MRTYGYLVVEADIEYHNELSTLSGKKLIINNSVEDVSYINRVVTVLSAPSFTPLLPGDKCIVHHNILRMSNDVVGNIVKSDFWIKDNLFYVPLTEVFAYKRSEEWQALSPYCFVKPHPTSVNSLLKLVPQVVNEEFTYKGNEKLTGTLVYVNQFQESIGLSTGDEVLFTPYSEHEFNIDGQVLYKMKHADLILVK
jgi:hypothetical protein